MAQLVSPSRIYEVGLGFWDSKTLLTAVKLEIFTKLGADKFSADEIKAELRLHGRGIYDFLDSLVSLGFLKREEILEKAHYSNTEETKAFLDKDSPQYIGGFFELANDRLYKFWGDLEEGLRTGKPQNELKVSDKRVFEAMYANPIVLKQFIQAMSASQIGSFIDFAKKFDFSKYNTLCDIGGANGHLSIQVALNNEHMICSTLDLPPVEPIAKETIEKFGLSSRISTISGDFFKDDFPKADVIIMGNILHDWNLENKKYLIQKAYDALPARGALVAIESIIDDERKHNSFGLLLSLDMLIETEGGFNFTGADFDSWCKEIGFKETTVMPLTGISSAVIAFK
ncbi:methyltransferase [Thermoproteota archaeon]